VYVANVEVEMDHDAKMLLISKAAAILGSSLLSVLFCVIPLKLVNFITHAYYGHEHHQNRWSVILCAITCFNGGVFFGTCMLSMLPELNIHFRCFKRLLAHRDINEHLINYPWPEFTASMGFFFIFFVEEMTLFVLKQRNSPNRSMENRKRTISDCAHGDEAEVMLRQKSQIGRKSSKISQAPTECGELVEPPVHPHPHSHVVRSLVLLLTLSFHTIVESMSYALHRSTHGVWTLFWTTNIHQAVVAFALGTQLARTHRRNVAFVISCVCLFSLCTPIGFLSGLGLAEVDNQLLTEETIVMILEGLAVGAFLYVTFYEVLHHELNNEHSSFLKLICITLGVLVIAGLSFFSHKNERFGEEVH